jgi:hypothetical protein
MKKILLATIIAGLGVLLGAGRVYAQKADGQSCHDGSECASGNCDPQDRVCIPAKSLRTTDSVLDQFDPLKVGGAPEDLQEQFSTPGGIISRVLVFAFPVAGLGLFVMLVVGGFQMVMAAGNDKGMQAGQQRVTFAIIGFLLLFSSYWIAQILGQILNIKIV